MVQKSTSWDDCGEARYCRVKHTKITTYLLLYRSRPICNEFTCDSHQHGCRDTDDVRCTTKVKRRLLGVWSSMTAVCAMVTAMQIFAVRLRAHGNILLPFGRKRLTSVSNDHSNELWRHGRILRGWRVSKRLWISSALFGRISHFFRRYLFCTTLSLVYPFSGEYVVIYSFLRKKVKIIVITNKSRRTHLKRGQLKIELYKTSIF